MKTCGVRRAIRHHRRQELSGPRPRPSAPSTWRRLDLTARRLAHPRPLSRRIPLQGLILTVGVLYRPSFRNHGFYSSPLCSHLLASFAA